MRLEMPFCIKLLRDLSTTCLLASPMPSRAAREYCPFLGYYPLHASVLSVRYYRPCHTAAAGDIVIPGIFSFFSPLLHHQPLVGPWSKPGATAKFRGLKKALDDVHRRLIVVDGCCLHAARPETSVGYLPTTDYYRNKKGLFKQGGLTCFCTSGFCEI
jgi:hypothetical protein